MNFFDPQITDKIASLGRNVRIGDMVKIVRPENLHIGDNVVIDDFTFINPGPETRIGSHVHIASFCCIGGGGSLLMQSHSTLSARVTIFTGSDDFHGGSLTNPTVPARFRSTAVVGRVQIGKHVVVGSGSVILPDTVIGSGAAVGAMTLVNRDVPEWTLVAGSPFRKIGDRTREIIEKLERELEEEERLD